jgi:hypothetical protein
MIASHPRSGEDSTLVAAWWALNRRVSCILFPPGESPNALHRCQDPGPDKLYSTYAEMDDLPVIHLCLLAVA